MPQSPPGLKTLFPSLPDSAFECIISSAQPPAGPNSSSSIETCCFHLRSCYWEGANKVWILPWARLKSFIPLDEPKTGPRLPNTPRTFLLRVYRRHCATQSLSSPQKQDVRSENTLFALFSSPTLTLLSI